MFVLPMYLEDVTYRTHFGQSSGPYHLSGLYCGGYEANLLTVLVDTLLVE